MMHREQGKRPPPNANQPVEPEVLRQKLATWLIQENRLPGRGPSTADVTGAEAAAILEQKADQIWESRTPDDSRDAMSPMPPPPPAQKTTLQPFRSGQLQHHPSSSSTTASQVDKSAPPDSRASRSVTFTQPTLWNVSPLNYAGSLVDVSGRGRATGNRAASLFPAGGSDVGVRDMSFGFSGAQRDSSQPYLTSTRYGISDSGRSTSLSAFSTAQSGHRPGSSSTAHTSYGGGHSSRVSSAAPHHHHPHHGAGALLSRGEGSRTAAAPGTRVSSLARQGLFHPAEDAETTVMWRYGARSQEYFMTKLTGPRTLANFKATVLSKEDRTKQFRFSFKMALENGDVVFSDEFCDDDQDLPLYEDRITATLIEKW